MIHPAGNEEDEPLEILDASGAALGVKPRGEVHRDGDWHRTFHCWVGGAGTGGPFVILQRRGQAKDVHPGLLDVSAAGHLAAGETDADGVRELEEELGIAAAFGELEPLGVFREEAHRPGIADRELCATFLLRRDLPIAAYRPPPAEIAGLVALPLAQAPRLLAAGSAAGEELDAASLSVAPVTVRAAELVPRPPERYAAAFAALERLVRR